MAIRKNKANSIRVGLPTYLSEIELIIRDCEFVCIIIKNMYKTELNRDDKGVLQNEIRWNWNLYFGPIGAKNLSLGCLIQAGVSDDFKEIAIVSSCISKEFEELRGLHENMPENLIQREMDDIKELASLVYKNYYIPLRKCQQQMEVICMRDKNARDTATKKLAEQDKEYTMGPFEGPMDIRVWEGIKDFRIGKSRNSIREQIGMNNKKMLEIIKRFISIGICEENNFGVGPRKDLKGNSYEELIKKWPELQSFGTEE